MLAQPPVTNPFRGEIVASAWESDEVDVEDIHQAAFDACRGLVERPQDRALLLLGEAGSGKTHLMRRFRHALTDPGRGFSALFTWVRLDTSPQRLWRHLRRHFAEDLLSRPAPETCQLRRLADHFAPPSTATATGSGPAWLFSSLFGGGGKSAAEPLQAWLKGAPLGPPLRQVLNLWFVAKYREEVGYWLRGDQLLPVQLQALGLPTADDPEDGQELEEAAKQVVLQLCGLAGPRLPVVFCFDHVESLGTGVSTQPALDKLAEVISALHDRAPNALFITCVQSSYFTQLKAQVEGAAWDRMAKRSATLQKFRFEEAHKLVLRRMAGVAIPGRDKAQAKGETYWPLTEAGIRKCLGPLGCTARVLLQYCAEEFDRFLGKGPPGSLSADLFLKGKWEDLLAEARKAKAAKSDPILEYTLPRLPNLAEELPQHTHAGTGTNAPVQLLFTTPSGDATVAVGLFNYSSAWLSRKLQVVRDWWKPAKVQRLVLIRDDGWDFPKTAAKTLEQIRRLNEKGGQMVLLRLPQATLQALRALHRLYDAALSETLENGPDTVSISAVEDWLRSALDEPALRPLGDLIRQVFEYQFAPTVPAAVKKATLTNATK